MKFFKVTIAHHWNQTSETFPLTRPPYFRCDLSFPAMYAHRWVCFNNSVYLPIASQSDDKSAPWKNSLNVMYFCIMTSHLSLLKRLLLNTEAKLKYFLQMLLCAFLLTLLFCLDKICTPRPINIGKNTQRDCYDYLLCTIYFLEVSHLLEI